MDAMEWADGVHAKGSCGLPASWYCMPHELLLLPALSPGRMLAGVPGPEGQKPPPAENADTFQLSGIFIEGLPGINKGF